MYDALGIGSGERNNQVQDAKVMYEEVEKKIKSSNSKIKRYGDGHSLGGHLIVTLGLITKNFVNIRGLNDAPVNVKQLQRLDRKFANYVEQQTGKRNGVSSKKLVVLANTYYKKQKATISHTGYRKQLCR
ncbi:hypothetical protein PVA20_12120 [Priestia sp. CNPSo 3706]|nr:hypothetical protein [Priestia megaterium]